MRRALPVGMTPKQTPRRIPLLAVMSIHDLRRLFREARTTGTVSLPPPKKQSPAGIERRRAA